MSAAVAWRSVPLKALYRRRDETGRPDLPLLSVYREFGVVPRADREDNFNRPGEDLSAYRVVHPGDLVVNKMKTWQGSLGVSSLHGIVSPAYFVCRQIGDAVPRFLHFLLRAQPLVGEYAARSKGIRPAQWDLPWDAFRDIALRLPPPDVQQTIANFLDAETVRIDALLDKKRLILIALRQRQDVEVKARLDADESQWLPIKRKWEIIDCKHRTPSYIEDGYPVVSPGDAVAGSLDLSRCHRFVDERDFADLTQGGRRPLRGDIIYTRNASVGVASFVDTDEPFCMGQDVCLIRSKDEDQRFLTYALNTLGLDQLEQEKIGSTFTRVNVARIGDLRVPVPSPERQRSIADHLDQRQAMYASLGSTLDRQVALLQERRQALITAAVTGQIDVPDIAA